MSNIYYVRIFLSVNIIVEGMLKVKTTTQSKKKQFVVAKM